MKSSLVIVPLELELPADLAPYFDALDEDLGFAKLYLAKSISDVGFPSINDQLERHGFSRLFESFWLPFAMSAYMRKDVTHALFSKIADDYDLIATSEKNISCYDFLYSNAKSHLQHDALRVLDFGCGTGLIKRSRLPSENIVLKGFDQNRRMVELAQEKGLEAFGPELYKIKDHGPFDVILASYVFHYQLDDDDWSVLLGNLVDGGILLGNFHKGIGLSEARLAVQSHGAGYKQDVIPSHFGPVLIVGFGSKGTGTC